MVNDICAADEKNNLLVKFADDITVTVLVRNGKDCLFRGKQHERLVEKELHESQPAKDLGDDMIIHGKTSKPKPQPLQDIKKKNLSNYLV